LESAKRVIGIVPLTHGRPEEVLVFVQVDLAVLILVELSEILLETFGHLRFVQETVIVLVGPAEKVLGELVGITVHAEAEAIVQHTAEDFKAFVSPAGASALTTPAFAAFGAFAAAVTGRLGLETCRHDEEGQTDGDQGVHAAHGSNSGCDGPPATITSDRVRGA